MLSLSGLRVLQQGIRTQQKRRVSVIKQSHNKGNLSVAESYFTLYNIDLLNWLLQTPPSLLIFT